MASHEEKRSSFDVPEHFSFAHSDAPEADQRERTLVFDTPCVLCDNGAHVRVEPKGLVSFHICATCIKGLYYQVKRHIGEEKKHGNLDEVVCKQIIERCLAGAFPMIEEEQRKPFARDLMASLMKQGICLRSRHVDD